MFKRFGVLFVSLIAIIFTVGGTIEASSYWPSDNEKNEKNASDMVKTKYTITSEDWKLASFLMNTKVQDWKDEPKGNVNLKKKTQNDKKVLKVAAASSHTKFVGFKKK